MKNFILSVINATKRHAIDTGLLVMLSLGASLVTNNGIWDYVLFFLNASASALTEPKLHDVILGYILIATSISILSAKHFTEKAHTRRMELMDKEEASKLELRKHELGIKEHEYQIERMKIKGDGVLKARELTNVKELESEKVKLDKKRLELDSMIIALKEAANDQDNFRNKANEILKTLKD